MQNPFENLREELLRAGIPPRHVSRYLTELREHLDDLKEQGMATGLDERTAKQQALARLGSETQLARAMIDKSPRSLAARAPWLVLALIPLLLLFFFIRITAFSMMNFPPPADALSPADLPTGYATLVATVSFVANWLIGPLLAGICVIAAVRQRLATRWLWVGLALVAVASGFLGFHMNFIPAAGSWPGGVRVSALGLVYEGARIDGAATVGFALLRAALLFAAATIAYRALLASVTPTRSGA